ncbi:MAG: PEP-CTERM system histidine kinase PrsK, partial [Sphingomonadaceae bacterium]|nr:PEP-CTERM system histidine kinase PrsK [Sphingomonadaceae bacterium]
MIAAVGQWSHVIAALLFAALAGWQIVKRDRRRSMIALGIAFGLTAIWAGAAAMLGADTIIARAGEMIRNLSFLVFMYFLLQRGRRDENRRFVGLIYIALLVFGILQASSDLLFGLLFPISPILDTVYGATAILQMSFAIGALLLVNALYAAAAPEARWGIRLTMIALAAMWAYDLNLYTFAWLTGEAPVELLALRGVLMIGLVPSFALSLRRNADWKMKLSRKVTFRSLSLIAIGGYFMLMFLASEAIDIFASDYAAFIQVALVFMMSVGAIVLLPSQRVRGWLKVKLAKHLFEHRYDYRAEWIRFNRTLARPADESEPLKQRVIRAIAEITEAPGGLLLTPDGEGRLMASARWNWPTANAPRVPTDPVLADWLATSAQIVELSPLRTGQQVKSERVATLLPDWMIDEPRAWALVPLIHQRQLTGAVLIEQPRVDRTLDWEDLDLLRIAGRQAASYLAEAQGQEALAEGRRFDEFNRRFAFIMHDLKNLVSQLSLVAR